MSEQTRHRITGGLFLLSLAVIFLPMLFDGDGVPSVRVEPIDVDFVPAAVPRFDEVVPPNDYVERIAELRQEIDGQGILRESGTRIGEPVLSAPNDKTTAWALQVASFEGQSNALDYRDRLRNDGYEAFLAMYKPVGGAVMHRVAVGPYLDVARAEQLQQELSKRYDVEARLMAFGN